MHAAGKVQVRPVPGHWSLSCGTGLPQSCPRKSHTASCCIRHGGQHTVSTQQQQAVPQSLAAAAAPRLEEHNKKVEGQEPEEEAGQLRQQEPLGKARPLVVDHRLCAWEWSGLPLAACGCAWCASSGPRRTAWTLYSEWGFNPRMKASARNRACRAGSSSPPALPAAQTRRRCSAAPGGASPAGAAGRRCRGRRRPVGGAAAAGASASKLGQRWGPVQPPKARLAATGG